MGLLPLEGPLGKTMALPDDTSGGLVLVGTSCAVTVTLDALTCATNRKKKVRVFNYNLE